MVLSSGIWTMSPRRPLRLERTWPYGSSQSSAMTEARFVSATS